MIRNEIDRLHQVEQARRDGQTCAGCGRALDPAEPVWVWRAGYATMSDFGSLHWHQVRAPHCADCTRRGDSERMWPPWTLRSFYATSCAACGRAMHQLPDVIVRRCDTCSESCRRAAYNAARRADRVEARSRSCAGCGAPFTARQDARYCSAACRQRAYRQRHHAKDAGGRPGGRSRTSGEA